jgi:hypothetical protein
MKKIFLFALCVLLFASLACNFGGIFDNVGKKEQAANILFQDDFSNTFSGWDSLTDENGVTEYKDGAYHIQVNSIGKKGNGMDMWANPAKNFKDVRVEVDVTQKDGPDDNDMGVICRYSDANDTYNFYYFLISSDGYAGIAKMVDGASSILSDDGKLTGSDAIKLKASNHIRADCIGDKLTLYVNGQQVASVSDSSFTSGDVGLIAGTFKTPGTDVLFDNFIVSKP